MNDPVLLALKAIVVVEAVALVSVLAWWAAAILASGVDDE